MSALGLNNHEEAYDLEEATIPLSELPFLQQVLDKTLQLDTSESELLNKIELLISEDPAFAVQVLVLANLTALKPINTINSALTHLGVSKVQNLLSTLSQQCTIRPVEASHIRLWTHSVYTAVSSRRIAQLIPSLEVDPCRAYLAGLLHDIGRFIMLRNMPSKLRSVDAQHWTTPEQLIEADKQVFKYTHSDLGHLAGQHWGLPNEITEIVRLHHSPIETQISPNSIQATTFCVQVADRLSMAVRDYFDINNPESEEKIGRFCIRSDIEKKYLSPEILSRSVFSIHVDSEEVLNGQGLSIEL